MRNIAMVVLAVLLLSSCAEEEVTPIEEGTVIPTVVTDSLDILGCCPDPPKCCP